MILGAAGALPASSVTAGMVRAGVAALGVICGVERVDIVSGTALAMAFHLVGCFHVYMQTCFDVLPERGDFRGRWPFRRKL